MDPVGHIVSASVTDFCAGCPLSHLDEMEFGSLLRVNRSTNVWVYGIAVDIRVPENEMVKQIAKGEKIDTRLAADNRCNRLVPIEVKAVAVGYREGQMIRHRLPRRPPAVLKPVEICDATEAVAFGQADGLNYLGLLTGRTDLPQIDLLLSHLDWMSAINITCGNPEWRRVALQRLRGLLNDRPDLLMRVFQG